MINFRFLLLVCFCILQATLGRNLSDRTGTVDNTLRFDFSNNSDIGKQIADLSDLANLNSEIENLKSLLEIERSKRNPTEELEEHTQTSVTQATEDGQEKLGSEATTKGNEEEKGNGGRSWWDVLKATLESVFLKVKHFFTRTTSGTEKTKET
ncbi:hypothetical protein RUM44_011504 [Polyplax serrata]|uniref:Secreted protein n=1 Tax=Polyplax serrata TaxID=468196 RepID=A0ABR1AQ84_POLSC